jgi:uncharacterized protein
MVSPLLIRKAVLARLAAAGAAIAVTACSGARPAGARLPPASLPLRRLGPAGPKVTVLGLGGAHLARVAESEARQMVEVALEEGVRFFDTAESYSAGRSERWLGHALREVRDEVFIMSKTYDFPGRSRDRARRHLEGTLERLGTDYLDLWQLHSIQSADDVDRAFAPGMAMDTLYEMQARGLVRHIGVTGHARPAAHVRALEHFDRGRIFGAMQLPINPIDFHQLSFQRAVLPGLIERGIGVIAMKTAADGRLLRRGLCTMQECLRFALALPVATAVVGMTSVAEVRENARLARAAPMSEDGADALLARLEPEAELALEWYKQGG